jgi:CRISPR-associated protein Csb1
MSNRLILTIPMRPIAGARFQPTGFPDLGAATFTRFVDGEAEPALLVESEQSVANHLERMGWDGATNGPVGPLAGLPYVEVLAVDGEFLTSSRLEAHRLSSAFVRESTIQGEATIDWLKARLGLREDRPLAAREIAAALFRLDPLCLIHGVFFADPKLPGQPKVTRALTGIVEAYGVEPADAGGVKRELVQHRNTDAAGSSEGYGSIPFHRTLWTAREIVFSVVLDTAQFRSYGLSADATKLLEAIAVWELRALLDHGMRLRTRCDLIPVDGASIPLPSLDEAAGEVERLVKATAAEHGGAVHRVTWQAPTKKAKKKGDPES